MENRVITKRTTCFHGRLLSLTGDFALVPAAEGISAAAIGKSGGRSLDQNFMEKSTSPVQLQGKAVDFAQGRSDGGNESIVQSPFLGPET